MQQKIRPCLDAARAAGLKIVYTTNYWPPMNWDDSEFGLLVHRTETGWSGTLEDTVGGDIAGPLSHSLKQTKEES